MNRTKNHFYAVPYYLWLLLFVFAPLVLLVKESFFDIHGQFTWNNYITFFTSRNYLTMTFSSFFYAVLVTLVTFVLSYPMAYFLSKTKHKQLWLLLIILPTWINLLLKAYAFIGILSQTGTVNDFLSFFGIAPKQLLFTDTAFLVVAGYIELPFMIMPIFNSINEIPHSLLEASSDLGATGWTTLRRVVFPMSMRGVRSGIQAVFIPSLSLFMLTRLIGGNRVITLGTAVEQHFLVTQNWGMGATIGVVLMIMMVIVMFVTRDRKEKGAAGDE
ncbi:ABC transporter permease [Aerococcaceae bacterium NML191292]|nr:ABC transporter permease [Aerococcaceae bacterium NML210727]MCW6654719.1 ABC transporter permease [Aerococcaceae bacterium NML201296]MCW6658967.1 ABC transporter permease [Aerococcaceae bacterium NML191292]MCW6660728.1 ABC transporter permease [Aerococcaceae bacterium NML201209]MCW6662299.1 ABC transporter permease [Aerococcaceae bacterium NML190073]MCW6664747.1 ABC transporter permease [Aerococcaceae bacterium NML191219]MCW6666732.1 ABC transporter permease [Aerococcaceae bacterium NML190